MRHKLFRLAGGSLALAAVLGACSSSSSSRTSTAASTTTVQPRAKGVHMRGKRYCEVLLVRPAGSGLHVEVFNTYPLNECPDAQWKQLDAKQIAAANGAPIAMLNGPRFWLMDSVEKTPGAIVRRDFGGIAMIQRATVEIPSVLAAMRPYVINHVDRSTVFTFLPGQRVFELHAADGSVFVMQSWSQMVDATLSEADLPGLGSRLHLPPGWTYTSRVLQTSLRVVTVAKSASVLQDELRDSYSMETVG